MKRKIVLLIPLVIPYTIAMHSMERTIREDVTAEEHIALPVRQHVVLTEKQLSTTVRNLAHSTEDLSLQDTPCETGLEADDHGNTLLHYACTGGTARLVAYLLSLGDNGTRAPHLRNAFGENLLHSACAGKNKEVLKFLLTNCALDLNATNYDGDTPLLVACENGCVQCVKLLLKQGANCELRDRDGNSPLMLASNIHQSLYIVRHLLRHKANPNRQDNQGKTILHKIAQRGYDTVSSLIKDRSIAQLLILHKANVEIRDNAGKTAYQYAQEQYEQLLDVFNDTTHVETEDTIFKQFNQSRKRKASKQKIGVTTDKKANQSAISAFDDDNEAQPEESLIHHVSYSVQSSRVVSPPVRTINSVEIQQKQSPWSLLSEDPKEPVSEELIRGIRQQSIAVSEQNGYQWTLLHYAALYKKDMLLIALLENAPQLINAVDIMGRTALHYACEGEEPNLVAVAHLLRMKQLQPSLSDANNKKPIDLTRNDAIKTVLRIFEELPH